MSVDEKCLGGMETYIELLVKEISLLWKELLLTEEVVSKMTGDASEENGELINVIHRFFDCYKEIEAAIRKRADLSDLIQVIESVFIVMFALQPYVSEHGFDTDAEYLAER